MLGPGPLVHGSGYQHRMGDGRATHEQSLRVACLCPAGWVSSPRFARLSLSVALSDAAA